MATGRPAERPERNGDERRTRRSVLRGAASLCTAGWLARSVPGVTAQERPITIDRDAGDLVVLPARADAAVTGTSTLQPNTDFFVRVFSQTSPVFERDDGTVVNDDGTWTATVDLSGAVDDQPITVEVLFNGDVVASAEGVVGPLSASVRFDDQERTAGDSRVVVARARLEVGGFVVVTDGADGSIRGVSDYLEGGTVHTEVAVALDAPIRGSEGLVATAWLDANGNQRFDVGSDSQYPAGDPVSDEAVVRGVTPTPDTTEPPPTVTNGPRGAAGLDVVLSVAGGTLGLLGLRRTVARVRDELYRRRDGWNRPPVAHVVSVPERPQPGIPVMFDGSLSFDPDPDDAVERYEWSIGGTDARGPRHVHVFGAAEEYDVELRVADGSGAVGHHGETVSVETRSGRLELAAVNPADPPAEFLTIRNAGDADLRLGGWSVHEASEMADGPEPGSRSFTFPDRFTLPADESVSIHTGTAPDEAVESGRADHHLYWGSGESVWSDRADALVVADADDHPVFGARYERTDDGYAIERVEPAALEDWFGPVTVDETLRIPVLGVTVGPRIGIEAIENGIDFIASCLFLRGSAAFASAWAQLTGFLVLFLVTWLLSTGIGVVRPSIDVAGPLLALLGAVAVTTVGGVVAATSRLIRWVAGRLS